MSTTRPTGSSTYSPRSWRRRSTARSATRPTTRTATRSRTPTSSGPMVPEAPLEQTEHGLAAGSEGWFVVNARETGWWERPSRGLYCELEGKQEFPQLGINVQVLGAGQPMSMYHYENDQEDFLVVAGEALLIVEGEERSLGAWDFVHCPAGMNHNIVGAGSGCVVIAVGARDRSVGPDWGAYRV